MIRKCVCFIWVLGGMENFCFKNLYYMFVLIWIWGLIYNCREIFIGKDLRLLRNLEYLVKVYVEFL